MFARKALRVLDPKEWACSNAKLWRAIGLKLDWGCLAQKGATVIHGKHWGKKL